MTNRELASSCADRAELCLAQQLPTETFNKKDHMIAAEAHYAAADAHRAAAQAAVDDHFPDLEEAAAQADRASVAAIGTSHNCHVTGSRASKDAQGEADELEELEQGTQGGKTMVEVEYSIRMALGHRRAARAHMAVFMNNAEESF